MENRRCMTDCPFVNATLPFMLTPVMWVQCTYVKYENVTMITDG